MVWFGKVFPPFRSTSDMDTCKIDGCSKWIRFMQVYNILLRSRLSVKVSLGRARTDLGETGLK